MAGVPPQKCAAVVPPKPLAPVKRRSYDPGNHGFLALRLDGGADDVFALHERRLLLNKLVLHASDRPTLERGEVATSVALDARRPSVCQPEWRRRKG